MKTGLRLLALLAFALPLPASAEGLRWSAADIAATLPVALQIPSPGGQMPHAVLDAPLTLSGSEEAELDFSHVVYDQTSRKFSGLVQVVAGGQVQAQSPVSGRIQMTRDVPVLTRALQRGEIIGAQDISWQRVTDTAANAQILEDPARIIGMAPRTSLRAGAPLRPADLQAPAVISRGSLVTMIYRAGTMELTAKGRALQDAALGESVRVVNLSSSRTIEGIAQRDGTVRVSGLLTN